jgi:NADPH2:quinone reductase
MWAWLLDQIGAGVGSLRLAEVPDPQPGEGEVLLDLHYAGLNPADRYLSEGLYPAKPALPHVLGRDGGGTVSAVGKSVAGWKKGDWALILRSEVGVSRWGTFATKVVVPAESLAPLPKGWSEEESAGGALVYLTAYQALTMWGDLPPSVVLITGASGGVGVASIHLARGLGHTPIALSRDPVKREQLLQQGAAFCADPMDGGWRTQVKQFLGKRRVDLAIDNVGGRLLPEVIETMADRGRISIVGRLAGNVPEFNTATLLFRRLRMGGVQVGAYTAEESRDVWGKIVQILAAGGRRPLVDTIFAMDRLQDAFARLATGPLGKVLLNTALRGHG